MIVFKKSSHSSRKQWILPLNSSADFRPTCAFLRRCRKTPHSLDSWIHEWFMDRQAHMNRQSSDIHSICHGSNRLPWKQSSNGNFPHGHPEFEAYPGKDHSKPQKSACPPERQDSPWISSAITSALPRIVREILGTWPPPNPPGKPTCRPLVTCWKFLRHGSTSMKPPCSAVSI